MSDFFFSFLPKDLAELDLRVMVNDVEPYEDFSTTQIPLRDLNGDIALRATFVSYNTNIPKNLFHDCKLNQDFKSN